MGTLQYIYTVKWQNSANDKSRTTDIVLIQFGIVQLSINYMKESYIRKVFQYNTWIKIKDYFFLHL